MEIIRFFDHSTGFDEVYEGYINGQLDKLIVEETNKQYNEKQLSHLKSRWMTYDLCSIC